MSEKVLTEEGLHAVPTTSNDDLLDIGEIDVNAAAKQTTKKKATFLSLTTNQAKDLQKTLKRRKTRRRTDAEPPLTKNTNHRTRKEIRAENAATVKHCRKKEQ